MRILLSNDDGYFAPGLAALAQALASLADITVVAPERDRSGACQFAHARPAADAAPGTAAASITSTARRPTACIWLSPACSTTCPTW